MVIENERKYQITQCLQCPICHQVIEEYILYFYPDWKTWETKGIINSKDLHEDVKRTARQIAEKLEMNLDFEQKVVVDIEEREKKIEKIYTKAIDEVSKLSSPGKTNTTLFEKRPECYKIIKWILSKIADIGKDACFKEDLSQAQLFIIDEMKKIIPPYSHRHNVSSDTVSAFRDIQYPYYKVIEEYCTHFSNFRYCNAEFSEYTEYQTLRDCRSAMFEVSISMQRRKTSLEIQGLNEASLHLFHEYIMSVPKSFGYNLSALMQFQGLTHQDLAKAFGNTSARTFQSLCEVKITESPQIDIRKIAQALLVSEDVLYYGVGKLYGIWDEILSEYSNSNLRKMTSNERNTARANKQNIVGMVAKMDHDEFIQMVSQEAAFFHERPYCVYLEENEGEFYYNYSKMYNQALHPKYIDILIAILKKA